jgi:Tfp pilus assembly protein PilF
LAQLGVAYLESQNYDQALVAFREALHIRRNFLGPRHLKCSKILNNIGCAQYSLDELEEARQTFEEALDIQRETLRLVPSTEDGQDSISADSNSILLSMASTLCNVGSIRLRRGQFDEADVALEEALLVSTENSSFR